MPFGWPKPERRLAARFAGKEAVMIQDRDRSAVVTVAPLHGLTPWDVGY